VGMMAVGHAAHTALNSLWVRICRAGGSGPQAPALAPPPTAVLTRAPPAARVPRQTSRGPRRVHSWWWSGPH
jgi:hypothetical protein